MILGGLKNARRIIGKAVGTVFGFVSYFCWYFFLDLLRSFFLQVRFHANERARKLEDERFAHQRKTLGL